MSDRSFFWAKNKRFGKLLIFVFFALFERAIERAIALLKWANEWQIAQSLFWKERMSNKSLNRFFAMSEWVTNCSIVLLQLSNERQIALLQWANERQIAQSLFCNERMSDKLLNRSLAMSRNERWANERLPNPETRNAKIRVPRSRVPKTLGTREREFRNACPPLDVILNSLRRTLWPL